ncbi:antibiotic biosynthesis monooxygenase family protein [Paraliobacillus salinarum]|uniref:antibiotic biosynthesis monooxygenase family protein n=1 Tax=Paraliobacillus salinarum TaxID=1158996 RepID=UPI0015F56E86|nr:antibiotic biosynthesis monooxygenase [Paraliobacillus salinarum]
MRAYMTNGTIDYLDHISEQHPTLDIFIMHNKNTGLAYYEITNKLSLFQQARVYEILVIQGKIQEDGFISMRHIPLTDDGKPVFENEWRHKDNLLQSYKGIKAYRILKPIHGNAYIVFMQWDDEDSFRQWEITHLSNEQVTTNYRAGKAFTTTYSMVDWEALEMEESETTDNEHS